MKKLFKVILLLLMVGVIPLKSQAAEKLPKPTDALYVNDFAGVIDKKVEEEIIEYGKLLDEKNGTQVVLVTVDFTNGVSLEDYAYKLFNKWGIGSKEKNNGLLILLSVGDDDYWAMQGEGLEDSLTSGKISGILNEYLEPDFAAKDYSAGAEKVYGAFIQELGGQWLLGNDEAAETGEKEETKDASSEAAIQYTYDKAGILSKKAETYINGKSNEINQLYGAGVYVATKDYCKEGLSFQEDAFNTFSDINAGSKDVLLVLYKEDDNYWVLPGAEAEVFATEDVLRDILDNTLEPQFAEKKYSQGAMNTADRFYKLLQANMKVQDKKDNSAVIGDKENSNKQDIQSDQNSGEDNWKVYLVMIILALLFVRGRRRKHYQRRYGVPFNPYSARHIRLYGPEGYWGHYGRPSVDYDNREPQPIQRSGFFGGSSSSASQGGAGRRSSGGSSWGSGSGAGRTSGSSSSGGGTSHSGGGGRSSGSSSFGGGSSRGGGAGRSSGSSRSSASTGHSSGAGRSTGGGGSSRGGGAGRKK
ncbi:TPM domain-containing protein [Anaerocolumna sp. AGMB13025]|uniref:TPM domain-containing protein n=1 Tax=Anaerocolumna sp. AGMB13025 TaxID=3039116 RepID=UPI00241BFDF3|nr:TPM domain-containing protein [Anaerocolumna sp. AGMB13025]WFR58856.1 TPM domain-containing protein [Anaerocolumna sp. AGMB13025]